MNTANQCRAMGLKVGDTVIVTDERFFGGPRRTKMTLLWLGDELAVFREWPGRDGKPYETTEVSLEGCIWPKEAAQ